MIHTVAIEAIYDRLVVDGGGRRFDFHGRLEQRRLSNGQRGVAMLAVAANRFEIYFASDESVTDKGFELYYEPFLGTFECQRIRLLCIQMKCSTP